jgi:hypothetical protein
VKSSVFCTPFCNSTFTLNRIYMRLSLLFAALFISSGLIAQTLVVKPYLQNADPTSMHVMWETSSDNSTSVEYGLTNSLGTTVSGTAITGNGASQVHDVELTGLTPATKYFYKAITGSLESQTYHFFTPPLQSSEASFNIVATSDMQQWGSYPTVFSDIVNDNIIPYVQDQYGSDLSEHLAYFAIPGDLVTTGSNYGSWASTFFTPAENLLSYVPLYPVPGNHEQNTPTFFKYFNLPMNGTMTNDYPEHWWYKDYSNVRLIGLESNSGYRVQTQLDWLQTVLDDAATDADIDFVFAQLHHPHLSELWIAGNTDYTGDVKEILENFSTSSGKPSVHFFGHTHGYSRGQSKEHQHVMVNVASGGGAIDNWGEFAQEDYPEFSRSDDDFGYVIMEVQAGADPQFLLKRLSHGNIEDGLLTNVLKDSLLVKFNNPSPDQPTGVFPAANDMLSPDCIVFLGSDFADSESDLQGATQWQIATDASFTNMVYDEWYQHENWYFDVDELAGNNMVDQAVTSLQENTTYYWRVRYRDRSLTWSDWSDEIMFQTTTTTLTANLITNGGAENGVTDWVQDQGSFESINSGECAGNNAFAGSKLFAVGGVCTDNAYGEGHQDVDVTAYQTQINAGGVLVNYGGYLSDYNGSDVPAFKVQFFDGSSNMISESPTTSHASSSWTLYNESMLIPANTETVRLVLMGTRNAGTDNDSYFDNLFVRLNLNPSGCEEFENTVGVSDSNNPIGVSVYPNPFSVRTTIEVEGPLGQYAYQLKMMDRTGRAVLKETSNNGKFIISGSSLASGFYVYEVSTKGWSSQGKLIVD